ncbi:hypothetical protein JT359_18755 [Candidatus Poribacteria bacterium]|nr:hypothetical protein [Candidatus Poribacteria bacterium]
MKIRKTIIFMIQNPSPLFLYFLLCWLLFSTLITISDDPFQYGALPDAIEELEGWSSNLPWSIWKFNTAIKILIDEIIHDLSYVNFWFIILPTLTIGLIEASNCLSGIENERKRWMTWFNTQVKDYKLDNNSFHAIPESIKHPLTSIKKILLHLFYWSIFFIIVTIIVSSKDPIYNPNYNILQTIQSYTTEFFKFIIPILILTLISNYSASRGVYKGFMSERQNWYSWYHQQDTINVKVIEHPPSKSNHVSSLFSPFIETVIFTLRNPTRIYNQFLVWVILIPILFFLLCICIWGIGNDSFTPHIIELFLMLSIPLSIIAYIMCYREAKGNIKGMKSNQNQLNNRLLYKKSVYNENLVDDILETDETSKNQILHTIKSTLILMMKRPIRIVNHIFGWTLCFVFVYGITNELFLEAFPDSIQVILIFSLSLISYYFEMKGYLIGFMNKKRSSIDWLNKKPNDEDTDTNSHNTTEALELS